MTLIMTITHTSTFTPTFTRIVCIVLTICSTVESAFDPLPESGTHTDRAILTDSVAVAHDGDTLHDILSDLHFTKFYVDDMRYLRPRDEDDDSPPLPARTDLRVSFPGVYTRRRYHHQTHFRYASDCYKAMDSSTWSEKECQLPWYCGKPHVNVIEQTWQGTHYGCFGDLRCDDSSGMIQYCATSSSVTYYTADTFAIKVALFHPATQKNHAYAIDRKVYNYTLSYATRHGIDYYFPWYCDAVNYRPVQVNLTHYCHHKATQEKYDEYCFRYVRTRRTYILVSTAVEGSDGIHVVTPFRDDHCRGEDIDFCRDRSFPFATATAMDAVFYCPERDCVLKLPYSLDAFYELECFEWKVAKENFYITMVRTIHAYIMKALFTVFNIFKGTLFGLIDIYFHDFETIYDYVSEQVNTTYILEISFLIATIYYFTRDFYLTIYIILIIAFIAYKLYRHFFKI